MSLLSKLTIVILTYNRHPFALRNMQYWSGSEIAIHVLDGSSTSIPDYKLSSFGSNIHYHHLPISLLARVSQAGNFIDTKYAILLGDDDLFLKSGLLSCLEELEADETLISCMGRCLLFFPFSTGVRAEIGYPEMKDYAILQENAVDRMKAHMNEYTCSTVYSVIRTQYWKAAVSALNEHKFPDAGVTELQFELAISFFGKSKVIPSLLWMRSFENPPHSKNDEVQFHKWWPDKGKKAYREKLVQIMASSLSRKDPNSYNIVAKGVEEAFDDFVEYKIKRENANKLGFKQTVKSYLSVFIFSFTKFLPDFLKIPARKALGVYRNSNPEDTTLLTVARNLEASGVKVDMQQVSYLNDLILQFHADQKSTLPAIY